MAISQEAVDRFLNKVPPRIPAFKGMDPEKLRRIIYDCTGAYYEPKTKPRLAQLEGLAMALYLRRMLLLFEMRVGKTKLALDWAEHLKRSRLWRTGNGLVIAHKPIALDLIWGIQIPQHCDLKASYVRSTDLEELIEAIESNSDLIVVPMTSLRHLFAVKLKNKKGVNKLYANQKALRIAADAFNLVIFDETHLYKNPDSLTFKTASTLVEKCKFRLGLTGTPVSRNTFDIWSQMFLIDGGDTLGYNHYFFQEAMGERKYDPFSRQRGLVYLKRSGKWEMRPCKMVFDKKKLPILDAKLAPVTMTYLLNEIQEVDMRSSIVRLTMLPKQQKAYDAAIKKFIEMIDSNLSARENQFIRMRQIASGYETYIDLDGNSRIIDFEKSAKIEWLDSFLDEINEETQVVIFHEWRHSGLLIGDLLKKRNISFVTLHGDTKDQPAAVKKFQQRQVQFIIAIAATGGTGIDLSAADHMIFFETPAGPIQRKQAEFRPMAAERGDRPLLIDDLVCAGVEDTIQGYLREGKDGMAAIMHDPDALFGPGRRGAGAVGVASGRARLAQPSQRRKGA